VNTAVTGPYLQQCGPDGALVIWDSQEAGPSSVKVTGPGAAARSYDDARAVTRHITRITGLEPETEYSYEVLTSGAVEAGGSFRTAPRPGEGSFTFAIFGDSGSGSPQQLAIAQVLENLAPDIFLHVGDLVYNDGAAELYEPRLFGPYERTLLGSCLYPVAGDHDLIAEGGQAFLDNFFTPANNPSASELYYSIDYGPAHITFLDTTPFERGGETNELAIAQMMEWLEQDLAGTEQPWKIAVLHHPPYSSGDKHSSYLNIRAIVSPLFERHGVAVAFSGDDHDFERTYPVREFESSGPGVTYIVTGGGGGNTRPVGRSEFTAYSAQKYHLVSVSVTPSSLKFRAIDQHGVQFDQFEIRSDRSGDAGTYTGAGSPAPKADYLVCAFDAPPGLACDFTADGVDDQVEIQHAIAACPVGPCAVRLSPGRFNTEARDSEDSIRVPSFTRLEFQRGTVIRFKGVEDPSDRYVIDMDGEISPLNDAYVGGPGRIEVTQVMDHGIRLKGQSHGVVIGDGLTFEHMVPGISMDEAVQVTGSIDIQDLTIRDLTVTHFGQTQDGAHGIEIVGMVRDSRFERITSVENRRAITLRGITDTANNVVLRDGDRRPAVAPTLTDKDEETAETVQLETDNGILVGSNGKFMGVYLAIKTGNKSAARARLEVSDGSGGWIPVTTVRDTTEIGGATLARTGFVEFIPPAQEAWGKDERSRNERYWLRITADGDSPVIFTLAEAGVSQVPIDNLLSKITSQDEVSEAVWVRSGDRNQLKDIVATGPGAAGVRLEANRGAPDPWKNSLVNVTVTGAGGPGVLLVNAPDTEIFASSFVGNNTGIEQRGRGSTGMKVSYTVVSGSSLNGIVLTSDSASLDEVEVSGNGVATSEEDAVRAGIRVVRSGGHEVTQATLSGGEPGAETQTYGLYMDTDAEDVSLQDVSITGNAAGDVYDPEGQVTLR
jgi:hypothetical protein